MNTTQNQMGDGLDVKICWSCEEKQAVYQNVEDEGYCLCESCYNESATPQDFLMVRITKKEAGN